MLRSPCKTLPRNPQKQVKSNDTTNIKTTAPGLQEDEAEKELGNGNIQDDMIEKRYNKYKAQKQTFDGRSYHSKKEADYAVQLEWLKKAGEIKEIIPQYKLDIRVNGKHITNYFIDFKVVYADKRVELVEVKGFETDVWNLKWKLTEALLEEIEPGAKLILVK